MGEMLMNELDFKGGEGWCGGGTKNGKGREDKRRVCCVVKEEVGWWWSIKQASFWPTPAPTTAIKIPQPSTHQPPQLNNTLPPSPITQPPSHIIKPSSPTQHHTKLQPCPTTNINNDHHCYLELRIHQLSPFLPRQQLICKRLDKEMGQGARWEEEEGRGGVGIYLVGLSKIPIRSMFFIWKIGFQWMCSK